MRMTPCTSAFTNAPNNKQPPPGMNPRERRVKRNLCLPRTGGAEVPFIWARDPKGRDPPNDSFALQLGRDPRNPNPNACLTLTLAGWVGWLGLDPRVFGTHRLGLGGRFLVWFGGLAGVVSRRLAATVVS